MARKGKVTIQGGKIGEAETDFTFEFDHNTFLANMPEIMDADSGMSALQDGKDIRCYLDEALTVQIPIDVKRFDIANDPANARVLIAGKLPTLPFGNKEVWFKWQGDETEHEAVGATNGQYATYHSSQVLDLPYIYDPSGSPPQVLDRTGNLNHGNAIAMEAGDLVELPFSDGYDHDGVAEYVDLQSVDLGIVNSGTFFSYVDVVNVDANPPLYSKRSEPLNARYVIFIGNDGKFYISCPGITPPTATPMTIGDTLGHFFMATFDTTGNYELFIDLAVGPTSNISGGSVTEGGLSLYMGAQNISGSPDNLLLGKMGVNKVWNVQKSANQATTIMNMFLDSPTFAIASASVEIDDTPPQVENQDPAPDETGVPENTDIKFQVTDDLDGVDQTSIQTVVDEINAIIDGVIQTGFSGSITAFGPSFSIVLNPDEDFSFAQSIAILIDADDLSANSMDQVNYSFQINAADSTSPAIPVVLSPLNGEWTGNLLVIELSEVTDPAGVQYRVRFATDRLFSAESIVAVSDWQDSRFVPTPIALDQYRKLFVSGQSRDKSTEE